ncbi:hypothetical protein [Tamlana sp. I1]|uniref:hypothetical protein n=1 Tax=Tamlana sp. I1 TaxID=2762061 RepID=UPI00188F8335|nr:hypothetical protein [Tamlana sp. I1]
MKAKFFTVFVACFIMSTVFAQKSLNQYKYVIVPEKYGFLNEKDQYQLNSLSAFLFEKYGFTVLMEGVDYPQDLMINRCLALNANVDKDSGMFKTKLTIILKDCFDKVVFTSKEGLSREKDFKTAYNFALRDAFTSVEALHYKYEPTTVEAPVPVPAAPVVAATVATVPAVAAPANATLDAGAKVVLSGVLYAQAIENGYQLVDSTPKVVYKLKTTHLQDVFLVENKSAIVYKKGSDWVVEYYDNNVLKQQVLNIKF